MAGIVIFWRTFHRDTQEGKGIELSTEYLAVEEKKRKESEAMPPSKEV